MEFSQLAKRLCDPQLSEILRSFSEKEEAIVKNCASRGWDCLNGSDYAKINELGRAVLKEMAENIWSSLIESYEASKHKPCRQELCTFFDEKISKNAHSISETIIARIIQQNANRQLPDFEGKKDYAKREIEAERLHLINLLSGRLDVFLGKMQQQSDSPLILKPSFYGIGIDLSKLRAWFKSVRRNKAK